MKQSALLDHPFGERYAAALPSDAMPTRRRSKPDGKDQHIDHVFVRNATAGEAQVISARGLSDHNLVLATVETH